MTTEQQLANIIEEQRDTINILLTANSKLERTTWGMLILGTIVGILIKTYI
jgi:hypothetical protein